MLSAPGEREKPQPPADVYLLPDEGLTAPVFPCISPEMGQTLSCANEHGQTQTTVTRSLSLALIKGKARPCFSLLSCLSTTRSCKARPARGHQHPRGRGRSSAGARTRMSTLQPPPSPGQGRGPTMTVRPDSTSSLHPPSTKSHIQLCTPTARHLFQGRLSIGNTPPETFEEKAKHLATSFI